MFKRTFSAIILLTLMLTGMVILAFNIQQIDAQEEYAYVAVSPYDYVALVDRVLNQVVGTIDVGASGGYWPWHVAIEPGGQYVYVSCRDSDNIVVIDREDNSISTVISDPALDRPRGICFTRDGAYALVGSRDASHLAVIDTSTYTVVKTVPVSSPPTSIATDPTGVYAYATSRWGSDVVSVIDMDSMTVVDTISVGSDPWGVVVSSGGEFAYVTNRGDSTVSVIDTSTNSVVHTISGVGSGPHGVEVSPDGSYLYVAGGWSGAVHVIDTATNAIVANLGMWPGRFDFAWDVAVTSEGDFIYVTNSKNQGDADGLQVSCIDASNNLIVATISMPDSDGDGYPDWGARGLAICPQRVLREPWDITGPTMWVPDGECDMRDVALVCSLFGAIEGDGTYDSRADITGPTYLVADSKIDMRDVALVCKHYGEISS